MVGIQSFWFSLVGFVEDPGGQWFHGAAAVVVIGGGGKETWNLHDRPSSTEFPDSQPANLWYQM